MNTHDITSKKNLMRKELRKYCQDLSLTSKRRNNELINAFLCVDELWKDINNIGIYLSDGSEPDLGSFIIWAQAHSKQLFAPRFNPATSGYEMVRINNFATETVPGKYGIIEPQPTLAAATPAEQSDLCWLIPGVGFDSAGNRLGRGKGYYDRLLQNCLSRVIGIFFHCQKVESIPVELHDRKLDMVLTENGFENFI